MSIREKAMTTPTDAAPRGPVAAIGRFSYRHRWTVLVVWLVVAAGGFLASGPVFNHLNGGQGGTSLESIRGYHVLDAESTAGGTVVGEVTHVDPASAGLRAAVASAAADLRKIDGVRAVATPIDPGGTALVARTGDGVVLTVSLAKLSDDAQTTAVAAIEKRFDALQADLRTSDPDAPVLAGGGPVIQPQVNDQVQHDLGLAEELSLPFT